MIQDERPPAQPRTHYPCVLLKKMDGKEISPRKGFGCYVPHRGATYGQRINRRASARICVTFSGLWDSIPARLRPSGVSPELGTEERIGHQHDRDYFTADLESVSQDHSKDTYDRALELFVLGRQCPPKAEGSSSCQHRADAARWFCI
jgi:hypothetical protein